MNRDQISELINKIKNASMAGQELLTFPHSSLAENIMAVLEKEGYIKKTVKKAKKGKILEIKINRDTRGALLIRGVERISHLSKRTYKKSRNIYPAFSESLIISTSRGVMTDREAKLAKLGGEVLFKIW